MSDVELLETHRRPRRDEPSVIGFAFSPWHLVLIPRGAVMVLPLLWMVVTSLQTLDETRHFPPILVPAFAAVAQLHRGPAAGAVRPLVPQHADRDGGRACVGNLLFCSLAGYAFARIRFFGREVVFVLVLATLMIPFQVVMIPTFLIVRKLGLIDTLGALILPNLAGAFGIFMLRQFFRTLPIELEEAARIDGASRLGVLFKIVLPLSGPALATLAVITFMWTWNDFLWPLITIYNPDNMTLQLGLDHVPGRAPDEHQPVDGGERDEHDAGAAPVLRRAAILRPRHRDDRAEGLAAWPRSIVRPRDEGASAMTSSALDDLSLQVADGEFLILVGPVGVREDDRAADRGRSREAHVRHDRDRRAGRERRLATRPRHRDGVPELRALPAHDGLPQPRVRAEGAQDAQAGDRPPRPRGQSRCSAWRSC